MLPRRRSVSKKSNATTRFGRTRTRVRSSLTREGNRGRRDERDELQGG